MSTGTTKRRKLRYALGGGAKSLPPAQTGPVYPSISELAQRLSNRFMLAAPFEEYAVLEWVCEELCRTLGAEVVAIRDLDPVEPVTHLAAGWSRHPGFLDLVDLPLAVQASGLPTTPTVTGLRSRMPVFDDADRIEGWASYIEVDPAEQVMIFCPLLNGLTSTGFVCVVLAERPERIDELVAVLTSVTAVMSQFRQRVGIETSMLRQMGFAELQGQIVKVFASARAVDAQRVLADATISVGQHLDAATLSLWELVDHDTIQRRMRWASGSLDVQFPENGPTVSVPPGEETRFLRSSGVSKVPLALLRKGIQRGVLPVEDAVEHVQFWSVPIMVDEEPHGYLFIGLPLDRELEEWEAIGLRSLVSLLPVLRDRFGAEEHLAEALRTSPTGVTLRNEAGELTDCNQAYLDFLGVAEKSDILGTFPHHVLHPTHEKCANDGTDFVKGAKSAEVPYLHADGHVVWGRYRSVPISKALGKRVLTHIQDVTDLRAEREHLTQKAHFDELTGLPNRHGFAQIVAQQPWVGSPGPEDASAALLMIDMNGFKEVNDTYGHLVGDEVLREVSNRLQRSIRSADRAVRYGGDEFVVLLDGPISSAAALQVALNLHAPLTEPVIVDSVEIDVSFSIGGTLISGDLSTEFAEALNRADAAMYRAKARGAGSTEFHLASNQIEAGPSNAS